MKEYRAIIIDDEEDVREALRLMLEQNCPEIRICGLAASAAEGREALRQQKIDFIFLDISMPRENGFDFLRSIPRENYGVIFVTAFEEYAIRAFKANAIDYLLKPVNPLELKDAVAKAIQYHEMRKMKEEVRSIYQESLQNLEQQVLSKSFRPDKITIAEKYGFRVVNVAEIMYLEAYINYTILHLSGLDKIIATRSLIEFENLLAGPLFFRIHKSAIINLNYLKAYSKYEGNFAELNDGTKLTISRRRVNEFREAVEHFTRSLA
jgi:two-component system, LytTR family, response regulator